MLSHVYCIARPVLVSIGGVEAVVNEKILGKIDCHGGDLG